MDARRSVSPVAPWVPKSSRPALPVLAPSVVPYRGFPRAEVPVREWIPGVSTPEGLLLGGAVAVSAFGAVNPVMLERLASGVTTGAVVAVSAVIPAFTVWFGTHLP